MSRSRATRRLVVFCVYVCIYTRVLEKELVRAHLVPKARSL